MLGGKKIHYSPEINTTCSFLSSKKTGGGNYKERSLVAWWLQIGHHWLQYSKKVPDQLYYYAIIKWSVFRDNLSDPIWQTCSEKEKWANTTRHSAFLILEIKHVQAPEYKTAQQIVKLHTGESAWKVHQTLSTSQVTMDINNTVRAELSINLRELTCSPAATVARLHLAPFVRRPPCWETVSQQSTAEEGREAEQGLLRLGTSQHRAGNGSNISISTRVICLQPSRTQG